MKQLIITKLMPVAACLATVQAADVFPFEQELDACLAQLNAISGNMVDAASAEAYAASYHAESDLLRLFVLMMSPADAERIFQTKQNLWHQYAAETARLKQNGYYQSRLLMHAFEQSPAAKALPLPTPQQVQAANDALTAELADLLATPADHRGYQTKAILGMRHKIDLYRQAGYTVAAEVMAQYRGLLQDLLKVAPPTDSPLNAFLLSELKKSATPVAPKKRVRESM